MAKHVFGLCLPMSLGCVVFSVGVSGKERYAVPGYEDDMILVRVFGTNGGIF